MQWIAQHKGLAMSIALVVGSVALAPAMASGGVMGGLMGELAAGAGDAAGEAMAKVDGKAGKGGASGAGALTGKLASEAGSVDLGATGAGDLGLDVPSVDDVKQRVAGRMDAAGALAAEDAALDTDNAVEVTPDKAQANMHLAGTKGDHRAAVQQGVGVTHGDLTQPGLDASSGANLAGGDKRVGGSNSLAADLGN
jgi:hypothetical protein